jgi:hypothetical protein
MSKEELAQLWWSKTEIKEFRQKSDQYKQDQQEQEK